jgi:hypothetical protein
LAKSLVTLGEQLSEIWPQGGPTDGTVGDLSHQARKSDHNPNAAGVVTAMDVDEVVEDRGASLVATLIQYRDPRVKYIIHEGKITRSYARTGTTPWVPSPYTGSNAHMSHVHISVSSLAVKYDKPGTWNLTGLSESAGGNPMANITVKQLQEALIKAGQTDYEGKVLRADGAWGRRTESAWVKGLSGSGAGGLHNHDTLYARKNHPHTIS